MNSKKEFHQTWYAQFGGSLYTSLKSQEPEIFVPAGQGDPRIVNLDDAVGHPNWALHLPHALHHVPGEPASYGDWEKARYNILHRI